MFSSELLYGCYFNPDGSCERIDLQQGIDQSRPHWLHFDYTQSATEQWLRTQSQLNSHVIDALVSEETRPRATVVNDGLLIALRGVNLAPHCDPEDMVSIRLWVEKHRVISTRKRPLLSVNDIVEDIQRKQGPSSPIQLVVQLTNNLMLRMTDTINTVEDKVSQIEDDFLTTNSYVLRSDIADLRRQMIALRRYLSPQREAMQQLQSEKCMLFSNEQKIQLRETTDHLMRHLEDLDSIRDRASLTQEELQNRIAEQMNNRMYVLSIVAAIFLPLGFFTGLLGINVAGIPGAEYPYAFALFIVFLCVLVALQVWLFKRNKWF